MIIDQVPNEESFELFLEDADKPTIVMDLEGAVLQVNDEFREHFDVEEEWNIRELFGGINGPVWDEYLNMVVTKKRTLFARRTIIAADNVSVIKLRLMYHYEERKIAVFFTMPQKCKDLNETYLKAFTKSDIFMFLVDNEGIIRDINGLNKELFMKPKEELIGKRGREIINLWSKCPTRTAEFINELVTNGHAEFTFQSYNDLNQVSHYCVAAFYDEETAMYITYVSDKTYVEKLKESLMHARTLSSVGKLAASIAHEIRNPMTTLKGFVQLLKVSASKDSENYLSIIDDEINRMESILTELLTLSKPSANYRRVISLQEMIADLCKVIHPQAQLGNVKIRQIDSINSEAFVYADSGKIKQVLFNIFKNSMEAMPLGGTLTIEIENNKEGAIKLKISDTGIGIPPSKLGLIFTPFFTRKELGTGLGLPFVKEIIEEHGGTVAVESEMRKGTKFTISFPDANLYQTNDYEVEAVLFDSFLSV